MSEHDRAGPGAFTRAELLALAAMGFILVVTVAWWALALWPVPGETPAWLARARAVCFNATENGLPDASGWLLLIGEPLGMTAVLAVVWKDSVEGALSRLGRTVPGRGVLVITGLFVLGGLFATAARVVHANERTAVRLVRGETPPEAFPRLDRPAPDTELVGPTGERFRLEDLRGRPVFVTFAFGHCETICPLVVRNSLEARERVGDAGLAEGTGAARSGETAGGPAPGARPAVVVISLDPWRDTPSRLDYLAEKWELDLEAGDRVLSGSVEEVEAVLDAWNVPRRRDPRTGDIAHPALVYLVDADGRIAFAANGDVPTLLALARRL